MYLGASAFDRIFLGAEFTEAKNGILYLRVRSEFHLSQLRREHVTLLAVVAEDILGEPIGFVDVLPRGAIRPSI